MNRKHFAVAAAAFALLLTACAGGATRAEPKRLLLAYEGPLALQVSAARPRLVVRAVSVPDYLDRRELVRRAGASEIVRDETAFWAERPAKSITRWIAQALAARRADYAVEANTTADGRAPDAVLAITLDGFEPGADGTVRLRGSWIYAPNGKVAARSGRFDADAATRDGSAEASVVALQQALEAAVQALAAQLPPAAFAAAPRG
ncbi:MAG: PqiC family protein [Pseudomonadota bacterium]